MKNILYIVMLVLFVTSVAAQNQNTQNPNLVREVVRQEMEKSNKEIIQKINLESDMCYKNIEDAANSYFSELRDDFRVVYRIDRTITLIGNFVSVVLAFLFSYFLLRRFEKKRLS